MPDKILILRTADDAADYIEAIEAIGYEPVTEPVLSIHYPETVFPPLEEGRPLIFTSAHGVRAFARNVAGRDYPVFAVGQNTAEEAQAAGFSQVEAAAGTATDLVELLIAHAKTGLKSPFYVRGEHITADLKQTLSKNGINSDEFIAYRADLAENLSISLLKSLDRREIKVVLTFSARGAKGFSDLVCQYGRESCLKQAQALCLGRGVVESLQALPFKEVVVANPPDRYGMMSLLQRLPKTKKSEDS